MLAKEKAEAIIYKFQVNGNLLLDYYECKVCALICVDEMIELVKMFNTGAIDATELIEYWEKVKEEIQKL